MSVEGNKDNKLLLPIEQYPHIHFFMPLPTPGRLLGIPSGGIYGPTHRWYRAQLRGEWQPVGGGEKLKNFATPSLDLFSFCRMLAKIGHSFAIAELGHGAFRPLVLDIILREGADIFHFVGYPSQQKQLPTLNKFFQMSIEYVSLNTIKFVVVNTRIFAQAENSPIYQVVVGECY